MSEQTPLLWHSNAPWTSTGYGQQTGLFAPGINEHYRVGISAFYGLEGNRLTWQGIPVYPGNSGDFGNKTLPPNAAMHFGSDLRDGLVVTLLDVWVLDPQIAQAFNMACWVPVDHEPPPAPVSTFLRQSLVVPLAMSRFGQEQLTEFDPLYVPHGIDTEVYRPIDRAEARDTTKLPQEAFIVGLVAANKGNPSRKCFAESLLAFKRFRDESPEAILYLHTEMTGRFQGVDMGKLIAGVGLPEGSVFIGDQDRILQSPLSPDAMAHFYSAFDVLLAPTAGEGFGLTVLEANACGTPAIVTDFSAQTEVCGAGWRVGYTPYWTTQDSWQAHPDIDEIYEALKESHALPALERDEMSKQARVHASAYDVKTVLNDYMLPALAEVERRYEARSPKSLKAAA